MSLDDRNCKWCGKFYVYKLIGGNNKYCSKKCEIEAGQSGKEVKAEKEASKAEKAAAKGSFVENLTKNIEDTKKNINIIKSFFGKGKKEEPTPSIPQTQSNSNSSVADELKKFKELLDAGVLTQEEFDRKKKELIG